MKNNEILSLGEAISRFLDKNGLTEEVKIQQLALEWERLMGKPIANHTEKIWFQNGTLYLKINSAVWRQELTMARKEIIKIVNQQLGAERVKEVRILG